MVEMNTFIEVRLAHRCIRVVGGLHQCRSMDCCARKWHDVKELHANDILDQAATVSVYANSAVLLWYQYLQSPLCLKWTAHMAQLHITCRFLHCPYRTSKKASGLSYSHLSDGEFWHWCHVRFCSVSSRSYLSGCMGQTVDVSLPH